jgi:hypothetical protein
MSPASGAVFLGCCRCAAAATGVGAAAVSEWLSSPSRSKSSLSATALPVFLWEGRLLLDLRCRRRPRRLWMSRLSERDLLIAAASVPPSIVAVLLNLTRTRVGRVGRCRLRGGNSSSAAAAGGVPAAILVKPCFPCVNRLGCMRTRCGRRLQRGMRYRASTCVGGEENELPDSRTLAEEWLVFYVHTPQATR